MQQERVQEDPSGRRHEPRNFSDAVGGHRHGRRAFPRVHSPSPNTGRHVAPCPGVSGEGEPRDQGRRAPLSRRLLGLQQHHRRSLQRPLDAYSSTHAPDTRDFKPPSTTTQLGILAERPTTRGICRTYATQTHWTRVCKRPQSPHTAHVLHERQPRKRASTHRKRNQASYNHAQRPAGSFNARASTARRRVDPSRRGFGPRSHGFCGHFLLSPSFQKPWPR